MSIDDIRHVPTIGFNHALDFCVWILEVDGLQVPPFDRHSGGNGSLQALGLDPANWRAWVGTVAADVEQRTVYQDQMHGQDAEVDSRYEPLFQRHAERVNERNLVGRLLLLSERVGLLGRYMGAGWAVGGSLPTPPVPQPAELWPGDSPLRERLNQLWASYKKSERANRRRYWKGQSVRSYLIAPAFQAFEREIESLRGPSPPITVTFVNYPGPVVYPIPPSVVMIGTRQWSADPPTFRDVVTDAASLLLARNGRSLSTETEPG